MLKSIFKNMLIAYLVLGFVAVPTEAFAVNKKSTKRLVANQRHVTTQKHASSKHPASSRHLLSKVKAQRVNIRLGRSRVLQVHHDYAAAESFDGSGVLQLASNKALIINQNTGEVLFAKNTNQPTPIASITKLMTAMVMLDAKLSPDELLAISEEDIDYLKGTTSRLSIGTQMKRSEFLQLALMASENRAASTLASNYKGGKYAFIKAMNTKARQLGLSNTHFVDPTGLDSENVSTAEDLVKMVEAAYQYPEIRAATTTADREVYLAGREYPVTFKNTNGLVREGEWEIGLSKTGFINEAGRCLVMQATIAGEPVIVVLLDSYGKLTRIGDANRVRKWMEYNIESKPTTTGESHAVIVAENP